MSKLSECFRFYGVLGSLVVLVAAVSTGCRQSPATSQQSTHAVKTTEGLTAAFPLLSQYQISLVDCYVVSTTRPVNWTSGKVVSQDTTGNDTYKEFGGRIYLEPESAQTLQANYQWTDFDRSEISTQFQGSAIPTGVLITSRDWNQQLAADSQRFDQVWVACHPNTPEILYVLALSQNHPAAD